MKTPYFIIIILFLNLPLAAQVGIGNTDPKASLDISASNVATPSNTDGLLIPRMDEFPLTNPTADQDGMMVFVTGTGVPAKGFYFWDQGTTSWTTVSGSVSDADWYEENTSLPPTVNTADIYTDGNVGLGVSNVLYPLQIETLTSGRTVSLLNENTGSSVIGLYNYINENSTAASGNTNGIVNLITRSNQSSISGVSNAFQNSTVNSSYAYLYGYQNSFGTSTSNITFGLINRFQGTTTTAYGLHNLIGGPMTTYYGVNNSNISGASISGTFYGLHNVLSGSDAGDRYGVFTSLAETGSGDKYGEFISIPTTAGGTHYGIYADVQDGSGYAGYLIGRLSLGNASTNRYIMPPADGTVGQIMTTDGAGNVTFQDSSAMGTTLDQAYDGGGAGAGRIITADNGAVRIQGSDGLVVDETLSIGTTLGVNPLSLVVNAANYGKGINASITGTGNVDATYYNTNSSDATLTKIGLLNRFSGENTGFFENGTRNEFLGSGTAQINGINNLYQPANSGRTAKGIYNSIGNNNVTNFYGVENNIAGARTVSGILRGVSNTLSAAGDGSRHGIYNVINGTGTGEKYGSYNYIIDTAGGVHYGIYSDVQKTSGYAGYFLGRTSLGTSLANRYLMPPADGTAGQVMTTNGAGQLSFSTPTSGAERIDDLTDGKSDTDGSQDGSSIFFGINAGTVDNGTDNQNVGIGYNAMQANTNGERNIALGYTTLFNNISGVSNTAIGHSAMYSNTSGRDNTAIGVSALVFNSTGDHNIAIGTTALWRNTTGSNNIGIGEAALFDHTIGEDNIALGYRSLYNITTGNENVALGAEAGLTNSTGIGNVYLGNDAGRSHVGSNTLWIENTSADANNALIYGEFDNDILRTNGELQIGNPSGAGYAFPTTDGTASYVLRTNGAGQLSFIDPATFPDSDTQNTLDQAYDEGGAGTGRTINATDGAVTIAGQDGFTVTGTINNGDFIGVTGAGTRMFFNPNKASFRAGTVSGTQWDNTNLGNNSVAFGSNNIASGGASSSLGTGNTSSGTASVTLGSGNVASGGHSVALNQNNTVSGLNSFAQGFGNTAAASASTAMGLNNSAPSWGEITVGANATTYTPTSTVSWSGTDRVFTVGNGAGTTLRSNALTVYKNGEVNINDAYSLPTADGTSGQVMTTDGAGNVIFQNAAVNTDNQNIENLSLNTTTNLLTVGIENGTSDTVDLSSLNPTKALARITLSADQAQAGSGTTKVDFDTEDFDIGNNFNLATDEFVVPADGVYRVHAQITLNPSTSTGSFDVRIRVDGSQVRRAVIDHSGSGSIVRQITSLLELTAGQVIDISFQRATGVTVNANTGLSYFEIEQL